MLCRITLCVPRYLKKTGSVKIQLKDVNHRRGKDEKTERDESGKLCLNRDSEKSTQSGRDPPFQSSDCLFFGFLAFLFLFYIAYFSSFERVLFSSLGACFDPCFQVLHLPSSSRQLQFLSFSKPFVERNVAKFRNFQQTFL